MLKKSSTVAEMGDRLATTDMGLKVEGRKVRGCCVPPPFFGGGAARSPSNTVRPISVPSGILIHPTVWLQYKNVTDRTDRQDRTTVR